MGSCLDTSDELIEEPLLPLPYPKSPKIQEEEIQKTVPNSTKVSNTPATCKTSHINGDSETEEPNFLDNEIETLAETLNSTIRVVAWVSRDGIKRGLDIGLLRFGEKGLLAAGPSGIKGDFPFKGSYTLRGDVVLERMWLSEKQLLQGQFKDGKIEGKCWIGESELDFTIRFECGVWDSKPTIFSLCLGDRIMGIGRTRYGWCAIAGEQNGPNVGLSLHYPDGEIGSLLGLSDGVLIKGFINCPKSQEEVYLLLQSPNQA